MIHFDFIGVDISKLKFDAHLLLEEKNYHHIFENTLAGCKAFLAWIKKYSQQAWVCLEATGYYGDLLAGFLHQEGITVSVVNPLQIKHFAKAKLNRNKNDRLDARTIAEFGKVMKPRTYVPPPSEQKQIREAVQLIDSLKKHRTQLENQLESVTFEKVRREFKAMIRHLTKQIDKLEKELKEAVSKNKDMAQTVALLESIKGIGFTTTISLIAYLPDLRFFKNAKQLAAFVGVSPKQRESGQYKGKTCLSKFGNPRLRAALYMPALGLKKASSFLRPFIQRLEKNGLKPKAIVGALMRKLLHIIFGVLKSNKPFDLQLV